MTNILQFKRKEGVDPGLYPQLLPADLVQPSTHLQCGGCGFSGQVKWFISTDGPECYQPVCNCPLPAILEA